MSNIIPVVELSQISIDTVNDDPITAEVISRVRVVSGENVVVAEEVIDEYLINIENVETAEIVDINDEVIQKKNIFSLNYILFKYCNLLSRKDILNNYQNYINEDPLNKLYQFASLRSHTINIFKFLIFSNILCCIFNPTNIICLFLLPFNFFSIIKPINYRINISIITNIISILTIILSNIVISYGFYELHNLCSYFLNKHTLIAIYVPITIVYTILLHTFSFTYILCYFYMINNLYKLRNSYNNLESFEINMLYNINNDNNNNDNTNNINSNS